ncbi:MAG: primosomal protein N' [Coriobacteriia bacterium]|nr:primosomal protein N' [Coriobacteriia bacterium]
MLINVLLDIPARALDAPFSYSWTRADEPAPQMGDCVLVEFGPRPALGYVVGIELWAAPDPNTKPIERVLARQVFDEKNLRLASWMASYYAAPLISCLRLFLAPALLPRLKKSAEDRYEVIMPAKARKKKADGGAGESPEGASPDETHAETAPEGAQSHPEARGVAGRAARPVAPKPERLSPEQAAALEALAPALAAEVARAFVIAGVTGSGKTEIYLQAIEQVLARGRTALTLVPEISLTPQTVERYRARFGDQVAVLHSRLTPRQRANEFERIRAGAAPVVVGARSALFAPLQDLGLIVIDEEHDGSYKQNNSPRYHAREVAEHLAALQGATLVLGSATPSLESLHAAQQGASAVLPYTKLTLKERVNGRPLPPVTVIDLTGEFESGNRSMFSAQLQQELKAVHKRGEKAMLLLNRRGFASFLLCRECGYVPHCESCSTSLSYHAAGNTLRCHQCNAILRVPDKCPECGSPYLRKFGVGTQQVEEELRRLIPDWPIVRMDRDTTTGAHAHEELLREFQELDSGVLVGTQMIAKGLDFPDVTLVGVVTADITLNLPDFRAPERTYQLLEQVAGRAGRADLPGTVIVQTYLPEESAIMAAAHHDEEQLYAQERRLRAGLQYPPYGHLCNVLLTSADKQRAADYAAELGTTLRADAALQAAGVQILGPTPCIIERAKKLWRFHLMLKSGPQTALGPLVKAALQVTKPPRGVNIAVDVDPYETM